MELRADIKTRVAAYLKARPFLTPTEFGLNAANNPSLVPRINKGAIGFRTIAKVNAYLAEQSSRSPPPHKRKRKA